MMKPLTRVQLTIDLLAVKDLYTNRRLDNDRSGICHNLKGGSDIVARYCESWYMFSGNTGYPIGGQNEYEDNDSLWVGDCLTDRLELLNHIMGCIELELNK